jgi:hypothetical protein
MIPEYLSTVALGIAILLWSSTIAGAQADRGRLEVQEKGGQQPSWQTYRGQPGPTGWRCHVIHPDPKNRHRHGKPCSDGCLIPFHPA